MVSIEEKAYSKQKSQGLIWAGIACLITSIGFAFGVPEYWFVAIIIAIFGGTAFILSAIEGLERKMIENLVRILHPK